MLVTVVVLFAGYQYIGDGCCFVCRLSIMLVTVVALFAYYRDVGDGCRLVCRLSRCW